MGDIFFTLLLQRMALCSSMIESFLQYLQYQKRSSHHTLLAYQTDLQQFSDFLLTTHTPCKPEESEYGQIRAWIISLVEQKLDATSVNRKIASLRSFFKFLMRHEHIQKDPMTRIRALKTKKKLPSFVKEGEMEKILENEGEEKNSFEVLRDRLIIELFYATGIRLSELIGLQEKQIDIAQRTMKVLGKRSKERVIPFPSGLVQLMKEYIAERNRLIDRKDHGLFFVTSKGERCYPMMVYRNIKEKLSQTSAERRSPHVLRHSYATHLLDRGAEISAVKELLGHSSLAATQVYTHNSMEKLKKVFDQAHPKA